MAEEPLRRLQRRLHRWQLVHRLSSELHPLGLTLAFRLRRGREHWLMGVEGQQPLNLLWLVRLQRWLVRRYGVLELDQGDQRQRQGDLLRRWKRRKRVKRCHRRYWGRNQLRRQRWYRYRLWRAPSTRYPLRVASVGPPTVPILRMDPQPVSPVPKLDYMGYPVNSLEGLGARVDWVMAHHRPTGRDLLWSPEMGFQQGGLGYLKALENATWTEWLGANAGSMLCTAAVVAGMTGAGLVALHRYHHPTTGASVEETTHWADGYLQNQSVGHPLQLAWWAAYWPGVLGTLVTTVVVVTLMSDLGGGNPAPKRSTSPPLSPPPSPAPSQVPAPTPILELPPVEQPVAETYTPVDPGQDLGLNHLAQLQRLTEGVWSQPYHPTPWQNSRFERIRTALVAAAPVPARIPEAYGGFNALTVPVDLEYLIDITQELSEVQKKRWTVEARAWTRTGSRAVANQMLRQSPKFRALTENQWRLWVGLLWVLEAEGTTTPADIPVPPEFRGLSDTTHRHPRGTYQVPPPSADPQWNYHPEEDPADEAKDDPDDMGGTLASVSTQPYQSPPKSPFPLPLLYPTSPMRRPTPPFRLRPTPLPTFALEGGRRQPLARPLAPSPSHGPLVRGAAALRPMGQTLLGMALRPADQTTLGRRRTLWYTLPQVLGRLALTNPLPPALRRLRETSPLASVGEEFLPLHHRGRRWWPLRPLLRTERQLSNYLREALLQLLFWRRMLQHKRHRLRSLRRRGPPHGRATVTGRWTARKKRINYPVRKLEELLRDESQAYLPPPAIRAGTAALRRSLRPRHRRRQRLLTRALFRATFRPNRRLLRLRSGSLPRKVSSGTHLRRRRLGLLRRLARRSRRLGTPSPHRLLRGSPLGRPYPPRHPRGPRPPAPPHQYYVTPLRQEADYQKEKKRLSRDAFFKQREDALRRERERAQL